MTAYVIDILHWCLTYATPLTQSRIPALRCALMRRQIRVRDMNILIEELCQRRESDGVHTYVARSVFRATRLEVRPLHRLESGLCTIGTGMPLQPVPRKTNRSFRTSTISSLASALSYTASMTPWLIWSRALSKGFNGEWDEEHQ